MTETSRGDAAPYDLIVIGAGIAGLNALSVALEYLPAGARVALVDRRARAGGMWQSAYDYVRLHQPHAMFTVGDRAWPAGRARGYLATGAEVRDHLQRCLDDLCVDDRVTPFFGWTAGDWQETAGDAPVAVTLRRTGGSAPRVLYTRRLIDAAAMSIEPRAPLPLSSRAVVSTSPERLEADDPGPDAPVVIIGGGKTGMDTAHHLIRRHPGRPVSMVTGQGTVFLNRDLMFPDGAARWWRGRLQLTAVRMMAARFDGTNEEAVMDWFRRGYCLDPTGQAGQFFMGVLSERESCEIAAGLDAVIPGYLDDVTDGADGPQMRLRGGGARPVQPGSVIVNCTGHLLREPYRYRPFLSPGGAIFSVNPRSALHALPGVAAHFGTHLFYRDLLGRLPLYEMDMQTALRQGRTVWYVTAISHTFHNTLVMLDALPMRVFDRCGLDLDRWFPLPRRLAALADVKLNGARYRRRTRAALDRVQATRGFRCGLLEPHPAEPEDVAAGAA